MVRNNFPVNLEHYRAAVVVDPQPRDPGNGTPNCPRPPKPPQPRDDGQSRRCYGGNNDPQPRDPGNGRRLAKGPQPRDDGSHRHFTFQARDAGY